MSNQLTIVQQNYAVIKKETDGFKAFAKLFELAGNNPEYANTLADKEVYHLAQLMSDNPDLAAMPPVALMMEMRKIPLQGVSLDPTLKLAYLLIQDKSAGKVSLEVTGRGKAVQAIAQRLIRDVDTQVIFEGDEIVRENGLNIVIPKFKQGAKVIGGFITITWNDGKVTQDAYNQSHIDSWRTRSGKRFEIKYENGQRLAVPRPNPNKNYTSFNGGIEPGFLQTKMLKHKLDRIGINPFPNAYALLNRETIDKLPDYDEADPQPEFMPDVDPKDYREGGIVPLEKLQKYVVKGSEITLSPAPTNCNNDIPVNETEAIWEL